MKFQIINKKWSIYIGIFLILSCSELPYSPYDRSYVGDYKFNMQINTDTIYPFLPYFFHFSSGPDSFSNFTICTDPSGAVDTEFFQDKKTPDSMAFYFTRPFHGTLRITGVRPNELTDSFSYKISVKNPVHINCIIISSTDTIQSYLVSEYPHFLDLLKKVIWYLDSTVIDTLFPHDTCTFPLSKNKDLITSAKCYNWQDSSFFTKPCTLFGMKNESHILASIPPSITVEDSIILSLIIRAHKTDTGTLTITFNDIVKSVPLHFSKNDTLSLKVNLGLAKQPGTFKIEVIYENEKEISQKKNVLISIVPSYRKDLISGVHTNPSIIYDKEPVTLFIQTGLSPTGNTCNNYYWSFDGDTIWDTITSMPVITSNFTGTTLRLAIRCSDSIGFYSNIYSASIPINSGRPIINELLLPELNQYTDHFFNFKIWATDNPGGMIDSFKLILINSVNDSLIMISDHSDISVKVDSTFCGKVSVAAQVKDTSGHWSKYYSAKKSLIINRGFPEIISLKFVDTVWFIQPAMIQIDASDHNGTLCEAIIDWDDSCTETVKINDSHISKVLKHTFKTVGKSIRTVKVSIIDNDNLQITDSVEVTIHEGTPLVKAVTSSISFRQDTILYVKSIQNPNNRTPVFDGTISFPMESFDSNGVIIKYYCDVDSPFSIEDAIGESYKNLISFHYCNHDSWFFTTQHPSVKSVVFAVDNDYLIGSDTVYINIDSPPPCDLDVMLPAEGDTIRTSSINFIWSGGIDSLDSLDTRFTLSISYHYDSTSVAFTDSLFYDGILRDFKDPSSTKNQFKISIKENLQNLLWDITPVTFHLTVSDRLGQSISNTIECFEQ